MNLFFLYVLYFIPLSVACVFYHEGDTDQSTAIALAVVSLHFVGGAGLALLEGLDKATARFAGFHGIANVTANVVLGAALALGADYFAQSDVCLVVIVLAFVGNLACLYGNLRPP